ncbi:MAG TPA: hypothetical protein VF042_12865 [Gemmatimonadaceae bacterium]
MFFDPRSLFLLIIFVGVTGWIVRGVMGSLYKLRREEKPSPGAGDIEERLRRIEASLSGVITDVAAIREKERFMARLQASRELQSKQEATREGDISPLVTQNIPVMPRVSR